MRNLFLSVTITAAFLTTAAKAETINCTEITSVPTIITVQGVYCLKSNKSSSLTFGNIIEIQTNNVTIDLNGFKLGGLGGGVGTSALGIHAFNRQNITIHNGSIRGFRDGVRLDGATSSGHLVEDLLLDGNKVFGIIVAGTGEVIRNNRVVNTGAGGLVTASGIFVIGGRNVVVADNIISGTSESANAEGIHLDGSALTEVRGNTILDTKDATIKRGISVLSGADITMINNRILNAAGTGTAGIIDADGLTTGLNCIGNTVAGFTAALDGCDFVSGNVTP